MGSSELPTSAETPTGVSAGASSLPIHSPDRHLWAHSDSRPGAGRLQRCPTDTAWKSGIAGSRRHKRSDQLVASTTSSLLVIDHTQVHGSLRRIGLQSGAMRPCSVDAATNRPVCLSARAHQEEVRIAVRPNNGVKVDGLVDRF